jgi:arylsulfatase A-like enzyme
MSAEMSRVRTRSRLAVVLLAALSSAGGPGCGGGAPARPRNVILISLDTLRPDHLGCYGHGRETSPALDALAARGLRCADASSAAPWTLPAHTTMFTGLYPSHHGVKDYSHRLGDGAVTLAEVLAERGFQTWAVINTWNLADPRFGIFQGFRSEDVHYVRETGPKQQVLNTGREVARLARERLEARDPARPFFLLAHFYDAHTDFTPDDEYRARFVAPYAGRLDGSTAQLFALRERGLQLPEADLRFLRELYDAEIRQLDDLLAEFFAYLADEGLEEETLIVVTSDHGEEFQEHGGLLHGRTQFEELLRVPLILAGPGVPRGLVLEEPVHLVDLLPTILGRLGIEPPGKLDGLDLAPAWGGSQLPERVLFGEADHNNAVDGKPVIDIKRSARSGSLKLHLDRHSGALAFFDLARDPREQEDLTSSAPERLAPLRAALDRFLAGSVAGEESGQALSGENLELLRQLGYAGEDRGNEEGEADGE